MKSKWQGLILAIFLLTSLAACSSSNGAGEKNRPAEEARPAANKAARRKNAAESAGKTAETKEADKTGKGARRKEIQADKASTIASAKEASGKARCLPRVKSQIVLAADYDAEASKVQGRLLAALVQNLAQVKQQAVRLEVAADPGCHRYFQPELPGRQTAYLYVEYADGCLSRSRPGQRPWRSGLHPILPRLCFIRRQNWSKIARRQRQKLTRNLPMGPCWPPISAPSCLKGRK